MEIARFVKVVDEIGMKWGCGRLESREGLKIKV